MIELKTTLLSLIAYSDLLLHLVGGFCITYAIFQFLLPKGLATQSIFKAFLGLLIVGIVWGAGEFSFNNYVLGNTLAMVDTAADIVLDVLGGLGALIVIQRHSILRQENKI